MSSSKHLLRRRAVLQSAIGAIGLAALGRTIFACSDSTVPPRNTGDPNANNDPTDNGNPKSDEYVPGDSPPVNVATKKLPDADWESRVKQLETSQQLFRATIFTAASPGTNPDAHVPNASVIGTNAGVTSVKVVVNHVMGANGLDAGTVDAGDGGKGDGGGDGGGMGMDAGDAGDGGTADAGATPPHYITTIYLRAMVDGKDTVIGLAEFSVTDPAPPTVNFTLPAGVTSVTAYEWCTLHGLWASAPLPIT